MDKFDSWKRLNCQYKLFEQISYPSKISSNKQTDSIKYIRLSILYKLLETYVKTNKCWDKTYVRTNMLEQTYVRTNIC